MRLTRAGEYAIQCVLYLARKGSRVLVSRKEIAEQAEIPGQFLAKIAQQLGRAGIIEIQQGAGGGYRLLPSAEQVTLLQVIEAIIGEIFLNDCVARPSSCKNSSVCSVHRVWCRTQAQLRASLQRVTFADLLADETPCPGGRPCLIGSLVVTEK